MAAVSPAFGSAYWAGATSSHPGAGHDREPRRGGPGISPGDSDAREPRDTDPRQHLWSPVGAAQLAVPPGKIPLRRSMTHCGRILVIQPPRTAAHPPRSKESSQSSAKPRQILPNPAKSCQILPNRLRCREPPLAESAQKRAFAGKSGRKLASVRRRARADLVSATLASPPFGPPSSATPPSGTSPSRTVPSRTILRPHARRVPQLLLVDLFGANYGQQQQGRQHE